MLCRVRLVRGGDGVPEYAKCITTQQRGQSWITCLENIVKLRKMKKIVYVFAFLVLVLNACVDQGSSKIEYTIFNETPVQVSVLGFVRDYENPENSLKADPIVIEGDDKFSVTRVTGIENDTGFAYYSIQSVDSVRVIFNNERVKFYGGMFSENCLICSGNENHQHIITEEDYNSAVPCSPCD